MSAEKEYDRLINGKWDAAKLPAPTPENAIKGARQIYRKATGKPWRGEVRLTTRTRYTWIRDGVMIVNPDCERPREQGWRGIVHQLSHWVHYQKHPYDRPHSERQTMIETDLTNYVLSDAFAKYR